MTMRWLTAVLVLFAGVCQSVAAQTSAVYEDEVLTVPAGAVIDGEEATFYRNIRLEAQSDGSFRVADLEEANLALVDSVDPVVDSLDPMVSSTTENVVEVTVQGRTSTPCVDVLDPAISRQEDGFRVVLGESASSSQTCVEKLEPFEITFRLDTSGLEPGTHTVRVNDEEGQFTLEAAE